MSYEGDWRELLAVECESCGAPRDKKCANKNTGVVYEKWMQQHMPRFHAMQQRQLARGELR